MVAVFAVLTITAFGQEDALQGTWFNEFYLVEQIFYNGNYEIAIYGVPNFRGEYTVKGNEITRRHTHFNPSAPGDEFCNRWYTEEEAVAEFGNKVDSWFEPFTQTFSINGNILILVDRFGDQQQFTRIP